jgi:hypothetical protein
MGLYTGLAHRQSCAADSTSILNCAGSTVGAFPNGFFFAGWSDTRVKNRTVADAFAAGFQL